MKRILTFFTLILVFISFAYTYDFSNEPNTINIIPFNAVSGIPVGSDFYKSDEKGEWVSGSPTSTKGVNYTNDEMIGIIMFMRTVGTSTGQVDMNGNITVTVTCPNGFYLQSQSNPNYKVPFEIMLFDSWNSNGSQGHKISEAEPTINVSINNKSAGGTTDNQQFHFDVVIRLPGTVDTTTNECTKDGVIYPLAALDDYSAVVTISVKYKCTPPTTTTGETNVQEKTVTVPFGGYYDGSANPTAKEGTVSMNIVLNSEASNIDIQNKLGKTINIGSLYYAMMVAKNPNYSTTSLNSAIFLSSSSDPYDTSATKFALVKDDVGATEALTSLNSVGFKLKVTSYEDGTSRTFDGTTYFPTSGFTPSENISVASGNPGDRNKSTQTLTSYVFIIPDMYAEYMAAYNDKQVYFSYSGSIELELDDNVVTMQSGRYIETVYVHVMAYK